MSVNSQEETLSNSFSNSVGELSNALKSANQVVPGCVTIFWVIACGFTLIIATFSTSLATLFTLLVMLFVSIMIYYRTQSYGESALALAAGLLAVFSITWDTEKAVAFLLSWIVFTICSVLIQSLSLAAKQDDILRETAIAIDLNNVDQTIKELKKTMSYVKKSTLGPVERADILRIFAHRKLPMSNMQYALEAVCKMYVISKSDYKEAAVFIYDIYHMFKPTGDDGKVYTRLLDEVYSIIRLTPVSPKEFIEAFNKSYRYALTSPITPQLFLKRISEGLSRGVGADEMYEYLASYQ